MLEKIRNRFLRLSMLVIIFVILAIISGVAITNLRTISIDSDMYLQWMASLDRDYHGDEVFLADEEDILEEITSPPSYFSVSYDISDHNILDIKSFERTFNINGYQIVRDFSDKAFRDPGSSGFVNRYRYLLITDGTELNIYYLDVDYRLDQFDHTMIVATMTALVFAVVAYFLLRAIANPIIRQISKEFEQQTRLMTNAGHLIKTPLTIIRANADVLKLDFGENESINEIKLQADRLTALTNDMITMSQMDERLMTKKESFNLSDIVEESVHDFQALFVKKNLIAESTIQPMLFCSGNEKTISQLISTLLENALKYSPESGKIIIDFSQQDNMSVLKIINNTDKPIQRESLPYLFERFYRYDSSRVPHNDSFGIGLSIAKTIVLANNGEIEATALDDYTFQICVKFPC